MGKGLIQGQEFVRDLGNDEIFRIKRRDESFFFEGDVSEISTLIEVDDQFVLGCAEVIRNVSSVINKVL